MGSLFDCKFKDLYESLIYVKGYGKNKEIYSIIEGDLEKGIRVSVVSKEPGKLLKEIRLDNQARISFVDTLGRITEES